jgi:UDPglucose 6-dehydrogenase
MGAIRAAVAGYGIVGQNLKKEYPDLEIIDPPKGHHSKGYYDLVFIAVPTDMMIDGACDTTLVEYVTENTMASHFCIKSTVPPGTTNRLIKSGRSVCFSPEYYGETINANGHTYDYLIVGGEDKAVKATIEFYKRHKTGNATIRRVTAKTAELTKYMENSFLALKVTFCQEFYRMAKLEGVDYDDLRECFTLDPRVGKSHTWVFDDQPFYDSKCLNKDIPAIVQHFKTNRGYDPELISKVIERNEVFKNAKKPNNT